MTILQGALESGAPIPAARAAVLRTAASPHPRIAPGSLLTAFAEM